MMMESTLTRWPLFTRPVAFGAASTPGGVALTPAVRQREAIQPPIAATEYLIALLCVALVATIRAALHPILAGASPLLIFVLPTVVMVMRNAPGPALVATAASVAASLALFIEPTDAAWWAHPTQQARLGIFVAESVTIVLAGWVLQRHRQRCLEAALQAERLRVVHVTMRTVHHVVNNSLNQLQSLRLDAEGRVPPESLAVFDSTVQETFAKLTALSNLRTYAEKPMGIGLGLDDGSM
jgi:K+-sensing histidine kinase KdpD